MNILDSHAEQVFIETQRAKIIIKNYIFLSLFPLPISDNEPKNLSESIDTSTIDSLIKDLMEAKDALRICDRISENVQKRLDSLQKEGKIPFYDNKEEAANYYIRCFDNIDIIKEHLKKDPKKIREIIDQVNESEQKVKNVLSKYNSQCDPLNRIII